MDEAFARNLEAIDWFRSCGQTPAGDLPFAATPVASWDEAIERCSDLSWENTTLEARNELTAFLSVHSRREDQNWNVITEAAKARVITPLAERVWQPFATRVGLGKVFVDCVSWDVLAAVMEHEYRACTGRPEWFQQLLRVYQAGHFPCGWSGEWPSGRLWVW